MTASVPGSPKAPDVPPFAVHGTEPMQRKESNLQVWFWVRTCSPGDRESREASSATVLRTARRQLLNKQGPGLGLLASGLFCWFFVL